MVYKDKKGFTRNPTKYELIKNSWDAGREYPPIIREIVNFKYYIYYTKVLDKEELEKLRKNIKEIGLNKSIEFFTTKYIGLQKVKERDLQIELTKRAQKATMSLDEFQNEKSFVEMQANIMSKISKEKFCEENSKEEIMKNKGWIKEYYYKDPDIDWRPSLEEVLRYEELNLYSLYGENPDMGVAIRIYDCEDHHLYAGIVYRLGEVKTISFGVEAKQVFHDLYDIKVKLAKEIRDNTKF